MPIEPRKITESRKAEREAMTPESRQIKAIEDLADTMEALRAEFVGFSVMLGTLLRK